MNNTNGVSEANTNSFHDTILTKQFAPGQHFQIQRYQSHIGEHVRAASDRYVIVQMCKSVAAERRLSTGNWSRFVKKANSLTLVPAGPVPDVRLLDPAPVIACALDGDFVRDVASEIGSNVASVVEFWSGVRDSSITDLLTSMDGIAENVTASGLYSDTLAYKLAHRFLIYKNKSQRIQKSSVTPLPARPLRRVQERIENGLNEKLSLASIARETGYSRAHFLRMFRAATGQTPHQYVLERRINAAQSLLRCSTKTLPEIALRCGFSSQAYMTDVFRRCMDMTPMVYRRTNGKK